jgi:ribonuclease HI
MGKNRFYAVVQGRRPGIYGEWFGAHGAEIQVKGFAGAVFKGFTLRREAEAWLVKMVAELMPSKEMMPLTSPAKADSPLEKPRSGVKPAAKERHLRQTVPAGKKIVIYTDGGCSKNPGPGGYGVVVLIGGKRRELSGGYARTTNNRMELTACIKGLEALEEWTSATLYSDSQYVVNGMSKGWAMRWRLNNWMRNGDEPAKNSDLWLRLLELCEMHQVRFQWVRGHNGNRENERCDRMAVSMSRRTDLPPDPGYGRK